MLAACYLVGHTPDSAGWHAVLTWDVGSGAMREAVGLPGRRFWNDQVAAGRGARWVGPRQLLLAGGHLVDLDLREQVAGVAGDALGGGADQRLWQLGPLKPD